MDWQTPVALGIVALTAAVFLWRRFRPRKFDFHKETNCGCSSPSGPSPPSIVISGRRGEHPTVTVKSR
jgi:hypothetical protein